MSDTHPIHWGISPKQLIWQDVRFKKYYTPPACAVTAEYIIDMLTEPLHILVHTPTRSYTAAVLLRAAYVKKCETAMSQIMLYRQKLAKVCTRIYKTPQKFLHAVAGLKTPQLDENIRTLYVCIQYIRELDNTIDPEFTYD